MKVSIEKKMKIANFYNSEEDGTLFLARKHIRLDKEGGEIKLYCERRLIGGFKTQTGVIKNIEKIYRHKWKGDGNDY